MSAEHDGEETVLGRTPKELLRLERVLRGRGDSSLPPDDAEIAAYVDGTMDDVSREIFETRLADDPTLLTEVRDLQQVRIDLAVPDDGRVRRAAPTRERPARVSWPFAWRAAAALLVLVSGAVMWWVIAGRSPAIRLIDATGQVAVYPDGMVQGLDGVSADLQRLVSESLRSGRMPLPVGLAHLRVEGEGLMGGSDRPAFEVTSPISTFVRTDRPTFRWRPLAGASAYQVSVYDERLGPIVTGAAPNTTEWTPPTPLPRSTVLLWQVEATTPGGRVVAPTPPDPQARFEVVSAAEQRAIEDRLQTAGRAHLTRAIVFAEAGLIDEARAEIDTLKRQNPHPSVLDALLASLHRGSGAP